MADDDIREGRPDKAKKKKAAPPVEDDERPRKKRPVEDDEPPPKKKKKAPVQEDEEEEEEGGRDLSSSPLSAILPVGGSIFALVSLWVGFLSFVLGVVALGTSFEIVTLWGVGKIPPIAACFMPTLWPISLLAGGLSFFTHKHKASYGSIAGNMRAIIGILLSLVALVMQVFLLYLFIKG